MAAPTELLEQRRSGLGQTMIGVRLADGSTPELSSNATQKRPFATMPPTLLFQRNAELDDFRQHVRQPALFNVSPRHGGQARR